MRGSFDDQARTGTATSVTVDDQLQGPAETVDVPSGTIVVLGQLVLTDATTVFEDKTLAELVINGQLVDYSSAQIQNAPPGGLVDGLFVEVKANAPTVGAILVVDSIEVKDEGFGGENGDEVDIEGVVSRSVSATDFVMNGTHPVRIGTNATFEGGSAADIAVNVRLEIKGHLNASGVLLAEEVKFDD